MKRIYTKTLKISILLFFPLLSIAQNDIFLETDNFLKKYVHWGQVNYGEIAKNKESLNKIVQKIERIKYYTFFDNLQKPYLINAYNLLVIKQVVEQYPFNSTKDIKSFWTQKNIIGGQLLSLEELNELILHKKFPDPRLHLVMINATNGCPPMPNFAFNPQKIDEQLNQQCKEILDNPTFVRIRNGNVVLSPIFLWYAHDFGAKEQSVINFINQFRFDKVPENYQIKHYEYDWTLNDSAIMNNDERVASGND